MCTCIVLTRPTPSTARATICRAQHAQQVTKKMKEGRERPPLCASLRLFPNASSHSCRSLRSLACSGPRLLGPTSRSSSTPPNRRLGGLTTSTTTRLGTKTRTFGRECGWSGECACLQRGQMPSDRLVIYASFSFNSTADRTTNGQECCD